MIWSVTGTLPAFDDNDISVEDSGSAVYAELGSGSMFVRVHSWSDDGTEEFPYTAETLAKLHPDYARFAGQNVRITIETIS